MADNLGFEREDLREEDIIWEKCNMNRTTI